MIYWIIIITGLAFMSNLIASIALPIQWIKRKLKLDDVKLFNCSTCLGFWIGFIFSILFINGFIFSLLFGCTISFVARVMANNDTIKL